MPSFTPRHYTPHRWQTFKTDDDGDDDMMEDVTLTAPSSKSTSSTTKRNLAVVPSDASLLDHFDLQSPPSTPHRERPNRQSFSSIYSLSNPPSRSRNRSRSPSTSSLGSNETSPSLPGLSSSPTSTPPTTTLPRWPTLSQRISRLPTRTRARSTSSSLLSPTLSSSTSPTLVPDTDVEMTGTSGARTVPLFATSPASVPVIRHARRTPYYPPNSSRNVDRTRVYMGRGPHYMQNWTPLSSLPRHVQLQIEERMVKFTA
ncbi:hypothetical protein VTJ49DRAFT_1443 [Mycothermus thermophilus]|uniref:Uncharacterized protein n=1 Tax=Humicola insolens TaxID=85995 RepID=A0ABR3VCC2_HUMIN